MITRGLVLVCVVAVANGYNLNAHRRCSSHMNRVTYQLNNIVNQGAAYPPQTPATCKSRLPNTVLTSSSAVSSEGEQTASLAQTIKVGSYFGLWYALNIGYNIYNKKALNSMALPWIVGTSQMVLGMFIFFPLWLLGIIKTPKVPNEGIKKLLPVGVMHMFGHMFGVISFGAGAISFTHIVKASEPLFTSAMSAIFFQQYFALPVYLTLVPVCAGVALASMHELTFSWLSFSTAMGSNIACALRGVFAKSSMKGGSVGENMDALNLYNVLTIISAILLIPLAAIIEGPTVKSVWKAAVAKGVDPKTWMIQSALSGVYYYLYNAVAFLALESVHPITHAVGNTIKRVVIIITSMIVFKTAMTPLGTAGSAVAIGGVLLYSLAKNYFEKKK